MDGMLMLRLYFILISAEPAEPESICSLIYFLTCPSTHFIFPLCCCVSLFDLGESDDAYLPISGGCRLLRVSVLLESGQQEEAADPLRPCVQPALQFRTQEICHSGRSKDIRLRCRFYPGCITSKAKAYALCLRAWMYVFLLSVIWEFGLSRVKGRLFAGRAWPGA